MSAISVFCEKCNGFRKRYCDGDRNTCMSILFDTIESLQQENEQLQAQLNEWKYETKCHMDEVIAREKQIEQLQTQAVRMWEALRKAKEVLYNLRMDDYPGFSAICEALTTIDKAIGGKEDV